MRSAAILALTAVLAFAGSDKKTTKVVNPTREAGNENIDIYATPYLERDAIKTALGGIELPEGVIAIEVKVVPRGENALSISRDDFQIISHKDGQRAGPFVGSQIAGSATLVVSTQTTNGGMYGGNPNGPVWGGIPGTMGRPRQMGSPNSGVAGSGTTGEQEAKATVGEDKSKKDNPLVAQLDGKILPDGETKETVKGFLYFPLDGKQKMKDISLIYKGPAGRLVLDFAPVK